MKAKITYEGMQRIERYFVPDAALREALLNALCHKCYESCIPIQVSVYEDRLYIANCGKLPENWTLENLISKHTSRPYNPSIAHAYYLAGYIESWGRDVEKICMACEEDGVFLPEYTIHPGDIMIKFTAPENRCRKAAGCLTAHIKCLGGRTKSPLRRSIGKNGGFIWRNHRLPAGAPGCVLS